MEFLHFLGLSHEAMMMIMMIMDDLACGNGGLHDSKKYGISWQGSNNWSLCV